MPRIAVDEIAVGLDLAVKQRDEARGEGRAADHPVELFDRGGDAQAILDAHAQSDDGVPRLQRRGEAVAGRVGDGDAEGAGRDGDEVEQVAADLLGRYRAAPQVVAREAGRSRRKQRTLDRPHLGDVILEPGLAQLEVDRVADHVQRVDYMFAVGVIPQAEGHDLAPRLADAKAYPRDHWADEVMAVADDAGFAGKPVLVGHSMGGFVAIATAVEYGDRLAGCVVLDSPVRRPDPEAEEGAHGKAFRRPKVYPSLETALEHYRLVPGQPCENHFILDHVARHSLHETAEGWTWKFDPKVFHRVTPRAAHEILPKVRCRVALYRAQFGMVTPDIGDYMYELLDRNAPVVEIPQCYHHMMLDQPLALVSAFRTLLADWEHTVPRRTG